MRNHGLVAFATTITLLAPIVVSRLTAGPKQEAMAFAPASRSLVVDGVGVEVSLDKVVGDPGETIQLHLEADRKVEVGIVMLGSTGTEGGRVPDPPLGLLHENVRIDVATGERMTKDVPIKLAGAVTRDAFASYTIYVLTPSGAKRLARLQRNATGPEQGDEGPPTPSQSGWKFEEALTAANRDADSEQPTAVEKQFPIDGVARLDAITRPRDTRLAIAMPDTAPPNVPFEVQVTASNPSNEAVDTFVAMETPTTVVDYRGLEAGNLVIEPQGMPLTLAPHESRRLTFHVTAKTDGAVALVANTYGALGAAFGATEVTDEQPAPRYVLGGR